jgi:hypothetical protein
MNLKQVVAISVVFAMPAFGQTPTERPPMTKADVQKIVQSISGDKTKMQAYCDLDKLEQQIANAATDTQTSGNTFPDLGAKADALIERIGPDYIKLMDGLESDNLLDEITAAFKSLDNLCK